MKISLLKNIIKEAVREAFKEEIKDSLYELYLVEQKSKQKINASSIKRDDSTEQFENFTDNKSLNSLLNETKNSLSREDIRNMFESHQGLSNNSIEDTHRDEGLDITNLDFVKTASKIYKASK